MVRIPVAERLNPWFGSVPISGFREHPTMKDIMRFNFPFLLSLFGFIAHGVFAGAVSAQTPWNAETGVVLVGKVVTMNDAGDVLPNARVWLSGGKIRAIARAGEALPDAAKDAPVVDSKGAIYPGIIDQIGRAHV